MTVGKSHAPDSQVVAFHTGVQPGFDLLATDDWYFYDPGTVLKDPDSLPLISFPWRPSLQPSLAEPCRKRVIRWRLYVR